MKIFRYGENSKPIGGSFEDYINGLANLNQKKPFECPELIVLSEQVKIIFPDMPSLNLEKDALICMKAIRYRYGTDEGRCSIWSDLKMENGKFRLRCSKSKLELEVSDIKVIGSTRKPKNP